MNHFRFSSFIIADLLASLYAEILSSIVYDYTEYEQIFHPPFVDERIAICRSDQLISMTTKLNSMILFIVDPTSNLDHYYAAIVISDYAAHFNLVVHSSIRSLLSDLTMLKTRLYFDNPVHRRSVCCTSFCQLFQLDQSLSLTQRRSLYFSMLFAYIKGSKYNQVADLSLFYTDRDPLNNLCLAVYKEKNNTHYRK